jgi:ribosome-binding factor A
MSRRTERVAEVVRQVVSQAVLFQLNDPRVKNVTVTGATVTGDLRHAKVYVSIMGDEKAQRRSLAGLKSAKGFLQRKVAERLDIRYTPVIEIVLDEGVKRSLEMSRILGEVLPRPPEERNLPEDETENDLPED